MGTASLVNAGFVYSIPFNFWSWQGKELEEQCPTSKYFNFAFKLIKRSNNAPKPGLSFNKEEVSRLKTKKISTLILSPSPESTSELDLGTVLQIQQKTPNSAAPLDSDKKSSCLYRLSQNPVKSLILFQSLGNASAN